MIDKTIARDTAREIFQSMSAQECGLWIGLAQTNRNFADVSMGLESLPVGVRVELAYFIEAYATQKMGEA